MNVGMYEYTNVCFFLHSYIPIYLHSCIVARIDIRLSKNFVIIVTVENVVNKTQRCQITGRFLQEKR
jgi:hypothetical protein